MIRPIDIRLNAAHPDYPLAEAVTFTGSPSTVLIRGVPPNCGRWAITAVSVAATYPDGSTTTRAAVQSANGVWVATLPATATSGRTANGLRILADGIDENGAAVTGYILGVADFAVASLAVTPAPEPGETSWQMLYFDAVPGTLRKGDVAKVDGVLKLYNGTAWEPFAGDIPAPSTSTPAMDGTGAAGTSAAYARGDHVHPSDTSRMAATATGADIAVSGTDATKIDAALAGKASTADATLTPIYSQTPTFSEWDVEPATATINGQTFTLVVFDKVYIPDHYWCVSDDAGSTPMAVRPYDPTATSLTFTLPSGFSPSSVVATRTRTDILGYQLGSQSDKPLASEAEAEALRTGKQDALSAQQLANIAAVPNKLDKNGGTMTGNLKVLTGSGTATLFVGADDVSAIKINQLGFYYGGTGYLYHLSLPSASGTIALTAGIPYDLVTKTISNGAVTLDDRAINAVAVSSSLASLTINFPTATSGKARDFGLRLTVASGVTTAPELVLPQGVVCENADGEVPEIGADGKATILYFTETASGVFLVKGEVLQTITA